MIEILASIGLGFFTGSPYQFPISPGRSGWDLRVGFVLGLVPGYLMTGRSRVTLKIVVRYGAANTLVVVPASVYAS